MISDISDEEKADLLATCAGGWVIFREEKSSERVPACCMRLGDGSVCVISKFDSGKKNHYGENRVTSLV